MRKLAWFLMFLSAVALMGSDSECNIDFDDDGFDFDFDDDDDFDDIFDKGLAMWSPEVWAGQRRAA